STIISSSSVNPNSKTDFPPIATDYSAVRGACSRNPMIGTSVRTSGGACGVAPARFDDKWRNRVTQCQLAGSVAAGCRTAACRADAQARAASLADDDRPRRDAADSAAEFEGAGHPGARRGPVRHGAARRVQMRRALNLMPPQDSFAGIAHRGELGPPVLEHDPAARCGDAPTDTMLAVR